MIGCKVFCVRSDLSVSNRSLAAQEDMVSGPPLTPFSSPAKFEGVFALTVPLSRRR